MMSSTTAVRLQATLFAGGVTVAVLLSPAQGLAQHAESNRAAADALYREARDLLKAGKRAEGCAKFEASLALYPAASTLINLARCHEQDGKLATAWADYSRALGLNADTPGEERRRGLEELARNAMRALEPRLPRLRVVIARPPPGVHALTDEKELAVAAFGEALPADPGPHRVRVSAPGYGDETRTVTLAEGKTAVVEIGLQRVPDPTRGSSARPLGIALTAGGVAGLGVGAVTGVLALTKIGAVKASCGGVHCPSNDTTDRGGLHAAKALGNVSTAGFVAGSALAAAGVVLLVLDPGRGREGAPRSSASVRVSLGPGRFDLEGSF